MPAKQAAMDLIRQLADDASMNDIVAELQYAMATHEALRRYDERGGIPDEDVTDEEWLALVARSWADDLKDLRQDIYTHEDGASSHEAR